MAGWIKFEKDLITDPRVKRIARLLRNDFVTHERYTLNGAVSLVVGALAQLWIYADTHITDDDILRVSVADVDEVVGIVGFVNLLPTDWLEVLDAETIKLPSFHEHNGTSAKKRALGAKRVSKHRTKRQNSVTQERYKKNKQVVEPVTLPALPDQDQDQDQDEDKNSKYVSGETVDMTPIRIAYPDCRNRVSWTTAFRCVQNHLDRGVAFADLVAGVQRYATYCDATAKAGTQYVLTPQKFFGEVDDPWAQPWAIPKTKADLQQDANILAVQNWLGETL